MKIKKGHRTRKQLLAEKEAISKKLVEQANSLQDPLASLESFHSYTNATGVTFQLTCQKVGDLPRESLSWIFDLMERNMKEMYQRSSWGWNESSKHMELTEPTAWYLIASCNNELMGFSHFRYDLEEKTEILYCYELQLEPKAQRQGLGRFMINTLEALASQSAMKKIILTVFKHNPNARTFFQSVGFKLDKTSPPDWESKDYLIISK